MRLFAEDIDDGRLAAISGAVEVTYGELKGLVSEAIVHLRRKGVQPSSRVAVAAGDARDGQSLDNWVAHLATLAIGATHASVTTGKALMRHRRLRSVTAVIGPDLLAAQLPPGLQHIPFSLSKPSARQNDLIAKTSHPSRLNFSSGTTGMPKLIEWKSDLLETRVDQVGQHLGRDSRVFTLLKIGTTAGFRYPLATWREGGTVVFRAREDDRSTMDAAQRSNLIVCSPDQLSDRLSHSQGVWPGHAERTIAVLGARLPLEVRDQALERAAAKVIISYGSTEGGNIAFGDSIFADRHPGSVGFVRDDVTLQIIDSQGKQCAPGARGLVRVRSDAVCPSAYSSGADGELWFYPGDLGVRFEDGLIAIEGRASETINVGGNKHSALDLEARLANLPKVRELCVCVVPLPGRDQATVAIVCEENANLDKLRQIIGERLPFRDFGVVVLPQLPRNAMGKVPRASLAKAIAASMQSESQQVNHA